jgi:hypothetical protein
VPTYSRSHRHSLTAAYEIAGHQLANIMHQNAVLTCIDGDSILVWERTGWCLYKPVLHAVLAMMACRNSRVV